MIDTSSSDSSSRPKKNSRWSFWKERGPTYGWIAVACSATAACGLGCCIRRILPLLAQRRDEVLARVPAYANVGTPRLEILIEERLRSLLEIGVGTAGRELNRNVSFAGALL